MSYQSTISRAFARYGYDQTIIVGGTNYTVRALMTILDSASINTFFDGNEAVGLTKPGMLLFVPGNDPNADKLENATFFSTMFGNGTTRPAQTGFIVRKIEAVRIAGTVIVYICACD